MRDIRGQRHFAEAVEDLLENALVFEADQPVPLVCDPDDFALQHAVLVVTKAEASNLFANRRLFATFTACSCKGAGLFNLIIRL